MGRYQESIYLNSQKRERVMSEYSETRLGDIKCCKGVQRQAGGFKWEYV